MRYCTALLFNLRLNLKLLSNGNLIQLPEHIQYTTRKRYSKMAVKNENITFQGVEDRFHGITVDSRDENCTVDNLPQKLQESLRHWTDSNKRGIWFKIALEHADWVPILAKNGFDFHHANNGFVMMYRWLPQETCNIPLFAHTMLGVGAIVENDNSEVLVVQEKYFVAGHWKFPGGIVEPGEHLVDAVVREVKEETNIDCEFQTVIAMMHANKGTFGCSDLYIVMGMKALSHDIVKCDRELTMCQWMNIHEYMKNEKVSEFNRSLMLKYLEYKLNNTKINFENGVHHLSKRNYVFYSVSKNV